MWPLGAWSTMAAAVVSLLAREEAMPRILEGDLTVQDQRFAVLVTRFNEFVTSKLLTGALDAGTAARNRTSPRCG